MSNDNNNWKWGQSSQNAFQAVSQFFGMNPAEVGKVKDADVTKTLKQADVSDIQVKRSKDFVQATKKLWKNNLRIGAMVHGLVRSGLDMMNQQQQQEATTTKEYAKSVTKTRTLSAKTQTAVEKTYLKGAKVIKQTGKDLQRFQGEVDEQYQVIDQTANQQSQQRRLSFRDRTQKRLAANSRPWRNY